MEEKDIDRIAQAIAAKIAEPGGPALLGCGSASSTQRFGCSSGSIYYCRGTKYECGGAAHFGCQSAFYCEQDFHCDSDFTCQHPESFHCSGSYST